MRAEACSIFLPDPESGELVIHSAQGESAPLLGQLRIPAGTGIVGLAMEQQRIIKVDDVSTDTRFYGKVDQESGFKTRCLIAAPLMDGAVCIGVIEYINSIERDCFSDQDMRLIEYFSWLVSASLVRIRSHQASIQKALLQRDLDLAREMQTGLLPTTFPVTTDKNRLELHAKLIPAYEVSGDLYDFFPAPDGKQFFLVGDVAGKGVAAGLFMAVTRSWIRAESRQLCSPVEILNEVNQHLVTENQAFLFVTIILGVYDPVSGEIVYAQGGHNPAVLLRADGSAQYEPTGGQPLGVFPDADYAPLSLKLQPGDSFIIYTDGITEAMNVDSEPYGNDRFLAVISGQHALSTKALIEHITDDVKAYANGAEQSDDITLLAIKRI